MTRALPEDCARSYRVVALIGEGAYGEVYRAIQLGLDRTVALKVLRAGRSDEPGEVQRFLAEAKITSTLSHPAIVIVNDFGHAAGVPWIAYEFLPGATLAGLGRLAPARVITAGVQLAQALAHAHERGVLHRDVKPVNVIEVERDRYKLGDFGIAKWAGAGEVRTRTGIVVGSPAYLAPELIAGEAATPQSDVYALAISLYELLAGRPPFEGLNLMEVLQGHLKGQARPLSEAAPDTPPALARAIERGMARDPADRWGSAAEFAAALERGPEAPGATVSGVTVSGARVHRDPTQRRSAATIAVTATPPRRSRAPRAAAVVALIALAALGARVALRAPPVPLAAGAVSFPGPGAVEIALTGGLPPDLTAVLDVAGASIAGAVDEGGRRVRFADVPPGAEASATLGAPGAAQVTVPVRTPPAWTMRHLEVLTSVDAVRVHFRYDMKSDGRIEVRDEKDTVKSRADVPAREHMFLKTLPGLSAGNDYRVIITPRAGWGPVVEFPVRTQLGKHLGDPGLDPEGAAMASDGQNQFLVKAFQPNAEGANILPHLWHLGKILRTVTRLIQFERRLVPAAPAIRLAADSTQVSPDCMLAATEYVKLVHDETVLAALYQRADRAGGDFPLYMSWSLLHARWADAGARAAAILARSDAAAKTYYGAALTVQAREMAPGPDSARQMLDRIEQTGHAAERELAQALIELDAPTARERFGKWLTARIDLTNLGVQGLALLGEDRDVAALAEVLGRKEQPLRKASVLRRLADLGTPAACAAIEGFLAKHPNHELALWLAGRLGLSASQPAALTALTSRDARTRMSAAAALGNLGDAQAGPALVKALGDPSPLVRRNAAWALGQLARAPVSPALRAYAFSDDDDTGVGAWALARAGDVDSAPKLFELFQALRSVDTGASPSRRGVIAYALRLLDHAPARAALDAAATARGRPYLAQCAAARPGPNLIAQFPFVLVQRTGVRLAAGQAALVRVGSHFQSDTGDSRPAHEPIHGATTRTAIQSALLVDQSMYLLERSARPFVAMRAQELAITTVPFGDLQDFSGDAGSVLRGMALVSIEPLPPARERPSARN